MGTDSVEKRFVYKVAASVVRVGLNIVAMVFVPRALTPVGYGQYGFLRTSFDLILNFLSVGSTHAFFVYHSKDKPAYIGTVFYALFSSAMTLTVCAGVWLAVVLQFGQVLWPDIPPHYVYLGMFLGIAQWLFVVVTDFADAKGETVAVERLKVATKVFGLVVLFGLIYSNSLTLTSYMTYSIVFFVLPTALALVYYKRKHLIGDKQPVGVTQLKQVALYYYAFCAPLLVYSAVSLTHDLFDRWFLQIVGGSAEQGYYSLAFGLASVSLLLISAMTPIFMREIGKAHGADRHDEIRAVFVKYSRLIYMMVAVIAVFFAMHAGEILNLFYRNEYGGAYGSLVIMAFYPLNAVYGQLGAAIYFATERTSNYRNIQIVLTILWMPVTYFILAPTNWAVAGLGLGALGLALKRILTQFISVNTLTYFNCRYLHIRFRQCVLHQVVAVCLLGAGLWVIRGGPLAPPTSGEVLANVTEIVVHGCLYALFVSGLIVWRPWLFGLERQELALARQRILRALR